MLHRWAIKWGVPLAALHDLQARVGVLDPLPVRPAGSGRSESAVQVDIRLAATQRGWRLWRNNVGALLDETGRPVRYGLANESSAMNKVIKSADLIGIRPVLIGPEHVGETIGKFVSIECKEEGWHFTGTPREEAQQAWAALVLSLGGEARFLNRASAL